MIEINRRISELRDAFEKFARDVAADMFASDETLEIPEQLLVWKKMDNLTFSRFLYDKLGDYTQLLDVPSGRDTVLDAMIRGTITEDPKFGDFLLFLKENRDDLNLYFDYLLALCALAKTYLDFEKNPGTDSQLPADKQ